MTTDTFRAWVREPLAALEHERWSHWQEYMHSKCERHADGSITIPADSAEHWERQIATIYQDLTPREKDSDRKEVDKILAKLWATLPPHLPEIISAMLEAYGENQRKEYYMTLSPEKLFNMLKQNIAEIGLALEYDNDVRGKCADVANYAAFILRVYETAQS